MKTKDVAHTPKSLRARLGLSQEELAERASRIAGSTVSVSTVKRLESGEDISLENVRWIAAALEVEVQALIEAIDAERARRKGSAA